MRDYSRISDTMDEIEIAIEIMMDDDGAEQCDMCGRDIWACACDDDDCPFCGENVAICNCVAG